MDEKMIVRFWSKVDRSGECWLWIASKTEFGYGVFHVAGRSQTATAHRLSWWLANGRIPDGLCVLHSCDNPPCVNPAHLFLGTREDNMRDKVSKGRGHCGRGEHHRSAKLAERDVVSIRAVYASGARQIDLANQYDISDSTVSNIISRRTWRHLP